MKKSLGIYSRKPNRTTTAIARRLLAAVFAWTLVLSAAAEDKRFALIIGNGNYQGMSSLINPVNDAKDIAAALKALGFDVTLLTDANRKRMNEALNDFHDHLAANSDSAGLFWYAGHGIQSKNENYLIPVAADIKREADLEDEAVGVHRLMSLLDDARNKLNLIVLDACRNNPLPSKARGDVRGLTVVSSAPPESVIMYSTGAGQVANDGSGRNSPFAQAFLKYVNQPGDITVIIKDVTAETKRLTNGSQVPYVYSSLTLDYSLAKAANPVPTTGTPASAVSGADFGTVTVAKGGLSVSLAGDGKVSLLGKTVDVPAGGTLPIEAVPVGDYPITVTYGDGRTERATATIRENRTTQVDFKYRPTAGGSSGVQNGAIGPIVDGRSFTNGVGMTLVAVTGGSYTMGSPENEAGREPWDKGNEKQHVVTVGDFYIGRTEVTQVQYRQVMGENPSHFKGDNLPVEGVSWFDAAAFCNKLSEMEGRSPAYDRKGTEVSLLRGANGYRLPTEAEWEYAARGGAHADSPSSAYAGSAQADEVAWYKGNSGNATHPIGLKKPNALGLYDMNGNVWQWCQDWYATDITGYTRDPTGPASGSARVERGGSWSIGAQGVRSANRGSDGPDFRDRFLGFRVALSEARE